MISSKKCQQKAIIFARVKKESKKSTLYYKKKVFEFVNRKLSDFYIDMTVYDKHLITWILERTISCDKKSEKISINDFIKGIMCTIGDDLYMVHAPVLMSRAKLLKTIKSLEANGVLIVIRDSKSDKDKNSYEINLGHEYFSKLGK